MYKIIKASSISELEKKVNNLKLEDNHTREIINISIGGLFYIGGEYHQPIFIHEKKKIVPVVPNQ